MREMHPASVVHHRMSAPPTIHRCIRQWRALPHGERAPFRTVCNRRRCAFGCGIPWPHDVAPGTNAGTHCSGDREERGHFRRRAAAAQGARNSKPESQGTHHERERLEREKLERERLERERLGREKRCSEVARRNGRRAWTYCKQRITPGHQTAPSRKLSLFRLARAEILWPQIELYSRRLPPRTSLCLEPEVPGVINKRPPWDASTRIAST